MFGHTQISTNAIGSCLKHYEEKIREDHGERSGWMVNIETAKRELEHIRKFALTRIAQSPIVKDLIDEYCLSLVARNKDCPSEHEKEILVKFASWLFNIEKRVYCTAVDCIKCESQIDDGMTGAKTCSEPSGFCKLQQVDSVEA